VRGAKLPASLDEGGIVSEKRRQLPSLADVGGTNWSDDLGHFRGGDRSVRVPGGHPPAFAAVQLESAVRLAVQASIADFQERATDSDEGIEPLLHYVFEFEEPSLLLSAERTERIVSGQSAQLRHEASVPAP
jgi:hypothetical protein